MKLRLIALLTVAIIASAGCSGGGGGGSSGGSGVSGDSEEQIAERVADRFLLTFFQLLTGAGNAQDFINVFDHQCREGVDATELTAALGFIRIFLPALAQAKVEDVDLGKLNITKNSEGYLVAPADPAGIKLKVNGRWVNADEYFKTLGLSNSGDSPTDTEEVLVVIRDGKGYVGDCADLQDFASDPLSSGSSTSPTVRPGSGGTPSPTAVGSSRTAPVRLGQSATVESKWQITVVKVNKDAWPAIQAASNFGTPPGAGEKMVLITVKVKNVSKDPSPESISDFDFKLTGSRNQLYTSSTTRNNCGIVPDEISATLFPNGETQGNVCFKVPSDETNLLLVWEPFDFNPQLTYFSLD